jgi:hypothetical protein
MEGMESTFYARSLRPLSLTASSPDNGRLDTSMAGVREGVMDGWMVDQD